MNKTTSSRRRRWFFARSMARAYQAWLETRAKSGGRSGSKSVKANARPLFAEALEPRVLFSAAPVAVDEPVEEERGGAEATAHTSEAFDSDVEAISGISFDDDSDVEFTEEDLDRLADEAIARWTQSGLTEEQIESLERISYVVSDFEGSAVAKAEGTTIYIDDDAAGHDWFIDETESLDEEFVAFEGYWEAVTGEAMEGIDLLTVIMHEQGHLLGLEHASDSEGVMDGVFTVGTRRLPVESEAAGAVPGSLEGERFAVAGEVVLFSLDFESEAGSTVFTSGGGNPSSIDTSVVSLGAANNTGANASGQVWGMNTEFSTAQLKLDTYDSGSAVAALNALPPGEYQLLFEYDQNVLDNTPKTGFTLSGVNGSGNYWAVHNVGHGGGSNQPADRTLNNVFEHVTISTELNADTSARNPAILTIVAPGGDLSDVSVFEQGGFTNITLSFWNTSGGAAGAEAYYDNISLKAVPIPAVAEPLVNLTFDADSAAATDLLTTTANLGSLGGSASGAGALTYAAGEVGGELAAQFDEDGNVVTYDIAAGVLDAGADFTVATSVYIDGNQSQFDRILDPFFQFANNGTAVTMASSEQTIHTTASLTTGWHHLALTFDSDASGTDGRGVARAYVDGVEVASNVSALRPDFSSGLALALGNQTSGSRPMTGLIDDVVFYDSLLLPETIAAIASPVRTVYVNDDWTQQSDIAGGDGNLETTSVETATFGSNAFGNLEDAIRALDTLRSVTLIINAGDYSGETLDFSAFSNEITVKFVNGDSEVGQIIAGENVTLELGGADGDHSTPTTLTVDGNFTASGASISIGISGAAGAGVPGGNDVIIVDDAGGDGTVTLDGNLVLNVSDGTTIATGTEFVIIDNDGTTDAVVGQFSGLAEGATVTQNGHTFVISYTGGDGNDVSLTSINDAPVPEDDLYSTDEETVITIAGSPRYESLVADLNPVAYWKFNEGTGTIANDSSGNGYEGVLVDGPAYTAGGRTGKSGDFSVSFDGVDDRVDTTFTYALDAVNDDFTWSFWAKSNQGVNSDVIIGNRGPGGEWVKFTPSKFEYNGNTSAFIDYSDFSSGSGWVFHTAVKSGNSITYYRDGVQSGPVGTVTDDIGAGTPLEFFIGGDPYFVGEHWKGEVDDVALFDSALTSGQITDLFDAQGTGLLANDSDVDNTTDEVTVTKAQAASLAGNTVDVTSDLGANVTVNSDGGFDYDPNGQFEYLAAGESVQDTFDYTVADVDGDTGTATATVTITGTNDEPVITLDAGDSAAETITESDASQSISGTISVTDLDLSDVVNASFVVKSTVGDFNGIDGQTLFSLQSNPVVSSSETENDLTWTFDMGTETFDYLALGEAVQIVYTITVDDGNGATDSQDVTITINGTNDVPVAVDDGTFGTVWQLGQDNGSSGEFEREWGGSQPAPGSATARDNDYYFAGTYGIGTVAEDEAINDGIPGNDGALIGFERAITSSDPTTRIHFNLAPDQLDDELRVVVDNVSNGPAGVAHEFEVRFNGALVYTGLTTLDGGSVHTSPAFTAASVGAVTGENIITITKTNSDGGWMSFDRITLESKAVFSTNEDTVLTIAAAVGVLTNDSDIDINGTAPDDTFTVTSHDAHSAAGGVVTVNADGSFTYDPFGRFDHLAAGESATDTFDYTITDSQGATSSATVTVEITGINDDPVAVDDGTLAEIWRIGIDNNSSSDFEQEGGANTAPGNPNLRDDDYYFAGEYGGSIGTVLEDEGTNDGIGGSSRVYGFERAFTNGAADSRIHFNLDAGQLNDEFVFTVDFYSLGGPNTGGHDIRILFNGVEIHSETITAPKIITTDAVSGTTVNAVTGDNVITIERSDDRGGWIIMDYLALSAKQAHTTNEDTSLVVDATEGVLSNDSDVDTTNAISVTAYDSTSAGGASVTVNSDGSFTYNPGGAFDYLALGETATDTFTYTITDSGNATDIATVTVLVTGINDAPVADDDSGAATESGGTANGIVGTTATGSVLANDSDPDASDTIRVSSITFGATMKVVPDGGSATIDSDYGQLVIASDGTYTFTLNDANSDVIDALEIALESFSYTVSDGSSESVTASPDVAVNFGTLNGGFNPNGSSFGTGFSGTWSGTGTLRAVTGSLSSALYNLPDTGNNTALQGIYGQERQLTRSLTTPITDEVWFSFLVNNPLATSVGGISFNTPVGDGFPSHGDAAITASGTSLNIAGTVVANQFTLGQTALVLGRVGFDADGNEVIDVWVDPPLTIDGTLPVPAGSGTAELGAAISTIGLVTYEATGVATTSHRGGIVDNFAVDSDLANVTGVLGNPGATLTISITGANDTPVANADAATAKEQGGANNDPATGSDATGNVLGGPGAGAGDVADIDVDGDDNPVADPHDGSVVVSTIVYSGGGVTVGAEAGGSVDGVGTVVAGAYGKLTIKADGTYSYAVENSAAAVEALDAGDSATDVFTYTILNPGETLTSTATITVTINGTDDFSEAVVDSDSIRETGLGDTGESATGINGSVVSNDIDVDDVVGSSDVPVTNISFGGTPFQSTNGGGQILAGTDSTGGTAIDGAYGTLTIGADGTYRYVLDDASVDSLTPDDVVTETFTYTLTGGMTTAQPDALVNFGTMSSGQILSSSQGSGFGGNWGATATLKSVTGSLSSTDYNFPDSGAGNFALQGTYGQPRQAVNTLATPLSGEVWFSFLVNNPLATSVGGLSFNSPLTDSNPLSAKIAVQAVGTDLRIGGATYAGEFALNQTALVLGRITFDADGNEVIDVWVDPPLTTSPSLPLPTASATAELGGSITTVGLIAYNDVAVAGTVNDGGILDNVAIDTRFSNVTGVATDSADLVITITGENDAPVAGDDTNSAVEAGGVANGTPGSSATGNVITGSFAGGPHPTTGTTVSGFDTNPELDGQVLTSVTVDGVVYTELQGATYTGVNSGGAVFGAINEGDPADVYTALSGLSVSTGRTNVPVSDFAFGSTINAGDGVGILLGEISISGQTGDVVTVVPLDAAGNPIGDFTLSISESDYGAQLGIMDVEAGGVPNISTRLTSFSISDFIGTGTLTGVAGIRLQDNAGYDPSVVATFLTGDTDVDQGDQLYVSNIAFSGTVFAGSTNGGGALPVGGAQTIDGQFGTLVINRDGSYLYTVNEDVADALDPGEEVFETFTYTVIDRNVSGDETATWDFTAATGDPTIQDWTVESGIAHVGTGYSGSGDGLGAGITENNPSVHGSSGATRTDLAIGSPAQDYIHETLLVTSPTIALDSAAVGSTTMVSVDFRGGDGNGSSGGVVSQSFTTPAEVLAFQDSGGNAGRSESNGQKGLAWLNVVTGVYDAVIYPPVNGDSTGAGTYTLDDLTGTTVRSDVETNGNFSVSNTYRLQFFDNDDGGWGWTQLATVEVNGTKLLNPLTDTADLVIKVTGANDTPVATPDIANAIEAGGVANTTAGVDPSGNLILDNTVDSDADGDDIPGTNVSISNIVFGGTPFSGSSNAGGAVTGTTLVDGAYGTLSVASDGSYTYTVNQAVADQLDALDQEVDTFTYTLTDDSGASTTSTLRVFINGANDTPDAVADTAAVFEASGTNNDYAAVNASGNVFSNDADPDAEDVLGTTVLVTTFSMGGTTVNAGQTINGLYGDLTINADGSYVYTQGVSAAQQAAVDALDEGDAEDEVFTYTISDNAATPAAWAFSGSTLGWQVLSGNEAFRGGDPVPDAAPGDFPFLLDNGHENFLIASPTFTFDGTTLDGTNILTFGLIGGAGNQSSSADPATPGDVIAYNGGYSNATGQKGVALFNVATGQYEHVFYKSASGPGSTDVETFELTAVDLGNPTPATEYQVHFFDNDEGSWGWGHLDSIVAAGTSVATTAATDSAGLTVTVYGKNDLPEAVADTAAAVEAGGNANGVAAVNPSGNVLDNDTDVDDDDNLVSGAVNSTSVNVTTVTFGGTTVPAGTVISGTYGDLALNADGTYTYTQGVSAAQAAAVDALDAGDEVDEVFTYSIADGQLQERFTINFDDLANGSTLPEVSTNGSAPVGTIQDGGLVLASDAQGSVQAVYRIPAQTNSSQGWEAGFGVLFVDAAGEGFPADGVGFSYGNIPATGIFSEGGSGSPLLNFVIDTYGPGGSNQQGYQVRVNGSVVGRIDTPLFNSGEMFNADVRVSWNPADGLSMSVNGAPVFTDIATPGFVGDDSYSFAVSARTGGADEDTIIDYVSIATVADTVSSTLTVTVSGKNDNPVAVPDTAEAIEAGGNANGTPPVNPTGNVLDNDTDVDDDDNLASGYVDPASVNVTKVTFGGTTVPAGTAISGTYGDLVVNADGTYTYTQGVSAAQAAAVDALDGGDEVDEVFTYAIDDGQMDERFSINFDDLANGSIPAEVTTNGAAPVGTIQDGGLVLTDDGQGSTSSVYRIPGQTNSSVGWAASFGVMFSDGAGEGIPADGIGFSYGNIPATGRFGETGSGSPLLNFAIDTYAGGGGDTAGQGYQVRLNGTTIGRVNTALFGDGGSFNAEVLVSWNPTDGLSVSVNGSPIFTDLATPGFVGDDSYTFAVSARTGGADENAILDYVKIATAHETVSSTLTVTVIGKNDNPVANADTAAAVEAGGVANGTPPVNPTGNVLDNDTDVDDDDNLASGLVDPASVDVTEVSFGGITVPAGTAVSGIYGDLVVNADGTYTYTQGVSAAQAAAVDALDAGDEVDEVFTYSIDDGQMEERFRIDFDDLANGSILPEVSTTGGDLIGTIQDGGLVLTDDAHGGTKTVYRIPGQANSSNGWTANFGVMFSDVTGEGGPADGIGFSYGNLPATGLFEESGSGSPLLNFVIDTYAGGSGAATGQGYQVRLNGTSIGRVDAALFGDGGSFNAEVTVSWDPTDGISVCVNGSPVFTDLATPGFVGDDNYTFAVSARTGGADENAILDHVSIATAHDTVSSTLTVTISGRNDSPVANNDTDLITETGGAATGETAQVSGNVIAGLSENGVGGKDTDVDDDDNVGANGLDTGAAFPSVQVTGIVFGSSAATGGVGSIIAGTYGDLVMNADGSYTYSLDDTRVDGLNAGDNPTEVFTYTIDDGQGGTDTATITITVRGTNDDPIAEDNANAVEEDVTLTATGNVITDDDGLNNHPDTNAVPNPSTTVDTDVDNVTGDLSVVPVGGTVGVPVAGRYGHLVLNADGSYVYTLSNNALVVQSLAEGEIVFDHFDYLLSDGSGGSDRATLTIKIAGDNDDPVTQSDTVTVFEGAQGGLETTAGNALSNDSDIDQNGKAPDDVLSVVKIKFDGTPFAGSANQGGTVSPSGTLVDGLYGTLSIDSNGEFVYTVDGNLPTTRALNAGEVGVETFTYLVSDGNGGLVEEKIVVRVVGKTGGKIGEFFGVGGSGILEGFRFAERRGHSEGEGNAPLLLLMPTYSGTAEPGSVITLSVMGPGGELLSGGSMTVVADLSGGWIAKFSGLDIGDTYYFVKVSITPPTWGVGSTGVFRTFFAPALNGSNTAEEAMSVDSVMGRRLSPVAIEGMIDADRHPNGSNEDWRKANGIAW